MWACVATFARGASRRGSAVRADDASCIGEGGRRDARADDPLRSARSAAADSRVDVERGSRLDREQARRRGLRLSVVLEINSVHLIKRLVATGAGYAIASRQAIAAELKAGTLSASRIVRPQIRQRFYLSVAGNREPTAAVRVVADLVREAARMQPAA